MFVMGMDIGYSNLKLAMGLSGGKSPMCHCSVAAPAEQRGEFFMALKMNGEEILRT